VMSVLVLLVFLKMLGSFIGGNMENSCVLQEIVEFLIKAGEHCLECEGKNGK